MLDTAIWTSQRLTGATLILGCVLFVTGAGIYSLMRDQQGTLIFGLPPRAWALLVFAHPRIWRWATLLFIAGALVTLVGLAQLTMLLRAASDPAFASLALLASAIGAVLWLIHLAARLVVDPWVGGMLAKGDALPEFYEPLGLWLRVLFVLYTILTFGGLVLFGGAVIASSLLPHWLGWTSIVFGLGGLGLLATTRDAPPFLHHLLPLVMGIVLLLL